MSVPPHERRALAALAALVLAAFLAVAAVFVVAPDPARLLARRPEPAIEIVDRYGEPLRMVPGADGTRYRPVDPTKVSPHLVHAVLAAEDRRFFEHRGLDPIALARAAYGNLSAGRVVSGGSTLSMQLARVLDPKPRGLRAKVAQALLAVRLEAVLPKSRILAEYLARVPMGNQVVGVEAAAAVYLGKSAASLSPAEAALLASIPRAPSRSNPWKGATSLVVRRDEVLRRMHQQGFLDRVALDAALGEPTVLAEDPFRLEAPHYVARVRDEAGTLDAGGRRIVGTLDLPLQRRVEALVRRHLETLAGQSVGQMAVAVLDVERGEWLALEGSGRPFDRDGGAIDGTRAARQPGSALKPFTYASAFDRGFDPATVLADLPRSFPWSTGTWTPRNYDDRFHGPLLARSALACSVNVPAAILLDAIGPAALLDTLRRAGVTTLSGDASAYGLGLTLGAGEVRLDELTNAYAALARGGEWKPARALRRVLDGEGKRLRGAPGVAPRRVCSPEAASQVVDILADPDARAPAFGRFSVLRLPFAAMVKTGTSEGFRDNWCVGGTREVMVGVWCGNFDRSPMGNLSGVQGAGALWREVVLSWAELRHRGEDLAARETLAAPPSGLRRFAVCALSGLAPSRACPLVAWELLRERDARRATCDWHVALERNEVATRWPALYREWATQEGLVEATAAAPANATAPATAAAGPPIEVLAPAHGDSFLIAPDLARRYQTLELRCSVRGRPRDVSWLVDGAPVARAAEPYSASWPLTPGTHRIQAVAGKWASRAVVITVYGG